MRSDVERAGQVCLVVVLLGAAVDQGVVLGAVLLIGRNVGAVPVVLQVTYIDPAGKPLSEDAGNPGCGFG